MNPNKLLTTTFLCLVLSTAFLTDIYALGSLGKQIQAELDVNPFLKEEGIKLRVVEEVSGYVTIELFEGSKTVRDYIHNDLASLEEWANSEASDKDQKAVYLINKAIAPIKEMDGVKDVLLTASVGKQSHQPEEKNQKTHKETEQTIQRGEALYASGHYSDAAPFLKKSADLGNPQALYLLGSMHHFGNGLEKNYTEAIKLYRKSLESGYAKALLNLVWLYATRPTEIAVDIDGEEALSLALKAVAEEPTPINYDALAAVYARNGQFDKAIETEKKAISLNDNQNSEFIYRLKLYEEGKAYILD
ncbi:MAG: tetratricopeptide repeat protein [Desulforhopalus sp.]